MEVDKWMRKIGRVIKNCSSGDVFEIKNLFSEEEWNKLSAGEKRALGREFSRQVNAGSFGGVRRYGEAKTHHAIYIKL